MMDFVDYVMEFTEAYPKHQPSDDKYGPAAIAGIIIGIIGITLLLIFH